MRTQLDRGQPRRLMYIENKGGLIDGVPARIGWATFSRSGVTVYYRDLVLQKGRGLRGNFFDTATGDEFWISGVKRRGSNTHHADAAVDVHIDADALEAYGSLRSSDIRRE